MLPCQSIFASDKDGKSPRTSSRHSSIHAPMCRLCDDCCTQDNARRRIEVSIMLVTNDCVALGGTLSVAISARLSNSTPEVSTALSAARRVCAAWPRSVGSSRCVKTLTDRQLYKSQSRQLRICSGHVTYCRRHRGGEKRFSSVRMLHMRFQMGKFQLLDQRLTTCLRYIVATWGM